jgi:multidrug/hemolysin transport system permease protein
VQWVIKIFPVSHSAVLLRKIMMAEPISRSFAGADVNSIIDFKKMMGIDFYYGKFDMTVIGHFLILVLTATLFYILTVIKISEKNKKGK